MIKTTAYNLQKLIALRLNLIICFLGYAVPFIFSHPQLVTGTVVNALIFTASEKLDKKSLLPILILPSLGAIAHGVLFGPQTMFLIYFLPFIWLGNFIQTSVFSLIEGRAYFMRISAASITKYLLLFLAANIYYRSHIVPQLFVTSMGVIQLATACMGGVLSYFILKSLKKND